MSTRGSKDKYRSSCAVDMNGTDQIITGADTWTKIECARKIWDFHGDFDLDTHSWSPPRSGIYGHDYTIGFKDIADCTKITVALFEADELWFITAERDIIGDLPMANIPASLSIDGWLGDVFDVRVLLTGGANCTATVNGSDDYTALGFDFKEEFADDEVTNIA